MKIVFLLASAFFLSLTLFKNLPPNAEVRAADIEESEIIHFSMNRLGLKYERNFWVHSSNDLVALEKDRLLFSPVFFQSDSGQQRLALQRVFEHSKEITRKR